MRLLDVINEVLQSRDTLCLDNERERRIVAKARADKLHVADCAACGNAIYLKVEYSIHEFGVGDGPELPLCIGCGSQPIPTEKELWRDIALRKAMK